MAAGLDVTIDDGLATVTLCRNGGNRLSWALLGALRDTARDLADRVDVRAVLLTAQGRDFSRGADLTDADLAERMRTDAGRAVADLGRRLIDAWAGLPQPTVVGLRGWVVGGAVGLALACDLRIAAPDTRFSLPEIDRAMHLGWGIIPRLVAEFGAHTARWLALTGESIAADRLPVGAVHVDGAVVRDAAALARDLADKPPLAARSIKATLRAATDAHLDAARDDAAHFATTVQSHDFAEGIAAFFEKRAPRYEGR